MSSEPSKRWYHGTDSNSAESICSRGLNLVAMILAAGDAGPCPGGFSLTGDPEVAGAWARLRAHERGGHPAGGMLSGGGGNGARHRPPSPLPQLDLSYPGSPDDMQFLTLNRAGRPALFDPTEVIRRVKEAFPEAVEAPGNQLALAVSRAERFFSHEPDSESDPAVQTVLKSLRRDAETYGPAYAFRIPTGADVPIHGLVRKCDVRFVFPRSLPAEFQQRLTEFLEGEGSGKLETAGENGQLQVLKELA